MHLLLTDRLACPRCGPEFGLILLAERMQDRRVLDGALGCPNCRDQFLVRDGFTDLRAPPRGELEKGMAGGPEENVEEAGDAAEAERLTALLGIVAGPGTVALVGGPARHAETLARAVRELQVVGVDADLVGWGDVDGVSRMVARPGIPFFSSVLRGVVVDGRLGGDWVSEAARVVAPRSRVVLVHADEGAGDVLAEAGLDVLASDGETVVAARS
jgi:uncharacterized protein YbaR (Trm112 family)